MVTVWVVSVKPVVTAGDGLAVDVGVLAGLLGGRRPRCSGPFPPRGATPDPHRGPASPGWTGPQRWSGSTRPSQPSASVASSGAGGRGSWASFVDRPPGAGVGIVRVSF